MNPPPTLPPRSRSSFCSEGFTLIELLVVISIIAILAGLLLPVVNKVMENARKTAAKSALTQAVAAVNSYQTDYGQYPVIGMTTAGTGDTGYTASMDYTFGTVGHNNQLFQVLRALNANLTDGTQTLNSRRVVYFEGKNAKNTKFPRDGFVTDAAAQSSATTPVTLNVGDLVDPWGNCYLVRIDANYSNAVQNPYKDGNSTSVTATDSTSTTNDGDLLHSGVAAFSYGLDGKVGTNGVAATSPAFSNIGDDVVSWQ